MSLVTPSHPYSFPKQIVTESNTNIPCITTNYIKFSMFLIITSAIKRQLDS